MVPSHRWLVAANSPAPGKIVGLLKAGRTTPDGMQPGRWQIKLGGATTDGDDMIRFVDVVAGETLRLDF